VECLPALQHREGDGTPGAAHGRRAQIDEKILPSKATVAEALVLASTTCRIVARLADAELVAGVKTTWNVQIVKASVLRPLLSNAAKPISEVD
jgi:hypothetical protein